MPTPAHDRFVISGTMPGGETFSTGFSVVPKSADVAELNTKIANVISFLTATNANTAALKALMNTSCRITQVDGYAYSAGSTAADFQGLGILNVVGTGTSHHPNQVAIVFTTRTAIAGRRGRGRMYWPCNGPSVDGTTGNMSSPTVTSVSTAAAALLNSTVTSDPVVISVAAGSAAAINAVEVDSRLDIIRGRADKQVVTSRVSAPV